MNTQRRDPLTQCQGKVIYFTFTEARKAAVRTSRHHEEDNYQAYHCPTCQRFHVGTRSLDMRRPLKVIR